MDNSVDSNCFAAGPSGVDGAVGVGEYKWFVAIVTSRHEKKVADRLDALGYDTFVATQQELHIWNNGRRKMVDRVVIPSIVFIRCTEQQRRHIVMLPFICRFMVNRSADSGTLNKPVAVVPADQMRRLQFMLGQSDTPVNFDPGVFKVHDNVRVIRGHLKGLEGEILKRPDGSHTLTVGLNVLGGATVLINPEDVERL